MDNPELYSLANTFQRKAGLQCIEEYANIIKWNKQGKAVIDLGCGDGSFTTLLKNYIPNNYKKIVGCDISEKMVKFASEKFGNENMTFQVWDIEGDLPQEFHGAFDHVFSFYALHWIKKQEKAFKNIYELLASDGDCLLTMLGHMPLVEVILRMSQTAKWKSLLINMESVFMSPYHKLKDPAKKVTEIMEKVGFKNVDVQYREMGYTFKTMEELKSTIRAVEPFKMPNDVFEEFMQDFVEKAQDVEGLIIGDNYKNFSCNYYLLVIYANK